MIEEWGGLRAERVKSGGGITEMKVGRSESREGIVEMGPLRALFCCMAKQVGT
jgi:hypothetical protein